MPGGGVGGASVAGGFVDNPKVFMTSIHFSMREEDLHDFFGEHNLKVVKLNVLKNEKGQSKGSGFVEFQTAKDANYAVNKLNGFQFSGKACQIEFAKQIGASANASRGGFGKY